MSETSPETARPHVLVLGRGKTGTTFTAKSIEASCPAPPTRFVMEPRTRRALDAAARAGARETVILKTLFDHWRRDPGTLEDLAAGRAGPPFHARIAIVRDPRDEAVSWLMFQPHGYLWTAQARPDDVERWAKVLEEREARPDMGFLEVCERFREIFGRTPLRGLKKRAAWAVDYAGFLEAHAGAFAVLRYEDAVAGDFAAVEPALGWEVRGTGDLGGFGQTRRTKGSGNWRRWFQPGDMAAVRDILGGACAALGYDDWSVDEGQDRTIDPAHHSGYARRLVDDFRRKGGRWRIAARRLRERITGR